ncbi:endophilin-B1 isoform A [Alligator mississippiensis]|uniref:Endophilin-B1 n=1 Tax=Alligator mississippiensis TaxID=8496 RepID=A0A151M595_ALLMI|nr:endophilin-B1 isoform A [Alligator mississippiensis]
MSPMDLLPGDAFQAMWERIFHKEVLEDHRDLNWLEAHRALLLKNGGYEDIVIAINPQLPENDKIIGNIQVIKAKFSNTDGSEIVLLTDGEDTTMRTCLEEVRSSGSVIHTIALGPKAAPELELFSKMTGADVAKNDGIYSRFFTSLQANGRYNLKVRVHGKDKTVRLGRRQSRALYVPGYIENGTIQMNAPRPEVNNEEIQAKLGSFSRTASGGSIVVSGVEGGYADIFPPCKIMDLEAHIEDESIHLSWTAPGGDLDMGQDARIEEFVYEKLDRKAPSRMNNPELLGQYMIDAGNEFGPGTAYAFHMLCKQLNTSQPEENNIMIWAEEVTKSEQEVRITQSEFDRQAEITRLLLEGISSTHAHHLRCLNDFVEAQMTYYAQCYQYMLDLQKQLGSFPSTFLSNNNQSSSTPVPSVSAPSVLASASASLPSVSNSVVTSGFSELKSSSGNRKARVLYDYDAANSSELSLLADEVITVYSIPGMDSDWLMGERGNQKGKVPITYLELLN